MERISLCPACTACPEIVMEGDTIRIGEDKNVVVLKKAEWNVLVDAIIESCVINGKIYDLLRHGYLLVAALSSSSISG